MTIVRLAYHPEGDRTLSDKPDIKMAYNPGPVNAYKALDKPDARLACNGSGQGEVNNLRDGPAVRLALAIDGGGATGPENMARNLTAQPEAPALLVSFVYLKPFLKNQTRYAYRDWVLDSGAFSAHASWNSIDLGEYIATCRQLLTTDPTLKEVYALDVIGDWRASLKNTETMWDAGIPAIPCYHVGEPEDVLKALARDYPKVALGGAVGFKGKNDWAKQCFARIWPKRIHGFGFGGEKSIMLLPWHSVDATNWEIGPCKYGRWQTFGKMSVCGSKQNLRAEIEYYLALEKRARQRWKKEMALLAALDAPAIHLAVVQNDRFKGHFEKKANQP